MNKPEYWLMGPLPDIPPLLQPIAHALLQAREEIETYTNGFPEELLWEKPAGVASVGFHLQHLTGVLDRLFTYAQGNMLTDHQLTFLSTEGKSSGDRRTLEELVKAFHRQVDKALQQLKKTDSSTLTEVRMVGRAQIPSTVIGLLVHAAEHTTRHVGQLLVTTKFLKGRML